MACMHVCVHVHSADFACNMYASAIPLKDYLIYSLEIIAYYWRTYNIIFPSLNFEA